VEEKRQITTLLIIAIAIALGACLLALVIPGLFEGDLVIADYQAELREDGTFTETYLYEVKVSGRYRMLFRYWDDPLSRNPLQYPYIGLVDVAVPPGTTGYVKEYDGKVTVFGTGSGGVPPMIENLAERNEVGMYNPDYFTPGLYQATYTYTLHPPLEYDEEIAHLNLRLVDRHIPFRNLAITIPSGFVREVYPHSPTQTVSEAGYRLVITGSPSANEVK